jgi:hypothetical protein
MHPYKTTTQHGVAGSKIYYFPGIFWLLPLINIEVLAIYFEETADAYQHGRGACGCVMSGVRVDP